MLGTLNPAEGSTNWSKSPVTGGCAPDSRR
jgi:hypothetical protein